MILSAAGAVDHDAIHELADTLFADVPAQPSRSIKAAKFGGGHASSDKRFEQCHVIFAFEGYANRDDRAFAARVLSGIAGGGMASRLFQEVREKRGLCYDIQAFDWSYSDSGIIGLHAATSPQQVKELATLALSVFADLAEKGPLDSELARANAQMKASLFMRLESCAARASQLAWDVLVFGKPLTNEELMAKIEGIAKEDVRAVAQAIRERPEMVSSVVGARGSAGAVSDAADAFLAGTPA